MIHKHQLLLTEIWFTIICTWSYFIYTFTNSFWWYPNSYSVLCFFLWLLLWMPIIGKLESSGPSLHDILIQPCYAKCDLQTSSSSSSTWEPCQGRIHGPPPDTLNQNLRELEPAMWLNKVSRWFLLYQSLRPTDLKTGLTDRWDGKCMDTCLKVVFLEIYATLNAT